MRLLLPILILLIAAAAISCKQEEHATAGLPDDWPVPQLTLAADWELLRGVQALHKQEHSPYKERTWLVVFRSDSLYTDAARHIEDSLGPRGYWRMRQGEGPSGFTSPDLLTYFSPDFFIEVKLGRNSAIEPAGTLGAHEYAVMVIEHDRPPEILQAVIDLRKTNPGLADKVRDTMLEPLQ